MVAPRAGQKEDAVTAASLYIEQGAFLYTGGSLYLSVYRPLPASSGAADGGAVVSLTPFAGEGGVFQEKMVRWSYRGFLWYG